MRETRRQQFEGKVISNKMEKTVVVEISTLKLHPQYKKYVRSRKKYKAHDEKNECGLGDKVIIVETRPLSKEKNFRIAKILEKGMVATGQIVEPEELFRLKRERRLEREAAAKAAEAEAAAKAAEAEAAAKTEAETPAEPEAAAAAPETAAAEEAAEPAAEASAVEDDQEKA